MKPEDRKPLAQIAQELMRESYEDRVGLWQVSSRIAKEFPGYYKSMDLEAFLFVVELLLLDGMTIGEYVNHELILWPGSNTEILDRVRRELTALGSYPNISDIGDFQQRPRKHDT